MPVGAVLTVNPAGLSADVAGAATFLYDCTDEKALGRAAPFACDLSLTTARVFASLPREIKAIALSATRSFKAGEPLEVAR